MGQLLTMNRVLLKLTSGRFILTVVAGITFAVTAIAGTLNSETIAAIMVMIFRDYFSRKRDENEQS